MQYAQEMNFKNNSELKYLKNSLLKKENKDKFNQLLPQKKTLKKENPKLLNLMKKTQSFYLKNPLIEKIQINIENQQINRFSSENKLIIKEKTLLLEEFSNDGKVNLQKKLYSSHQNFYKNNFNKFSKVIINCKNKNLKEKCSELKLKEYPLKYNDKIKNGLKYCFNAKIKNVDENSNLLKSINNNKNFNKKEDLFNIVRLCDSKNKGLKEIGRNKNLDIESSSKDNK